jgi:hypothetical protein
LAVKRPGKRRSSSFPPPAKSARLAFRGTSALNLKMFPLAGDAPAADEEEEQAAADEARRSGVSGPKSAARRSVQ